MLLDTHALLWFLAGDPRLGRSNRSQIESGSTVSAASIWEIAIKASLGELDAPGDLPERLADLGFEVLPVSIDHAWGVRDLPFRHRDPFDRLLVAQARFEEMPILSADPVFSEYDVEVIWGR